MIISMLLTVGEIARPLTVLLSCHAEKLAYIIDSTECAGTGRFHRFQAKALISSGCSV